MIIPSHDRFKLTGLHFNGAALSIQDISPVSPVFFQKQSAVRMINHNLSQLRDLGADFPVDDPGPLISVCYITVHSRHITQRPVFFRHGIFLCGTDPECIRPPRLYPHFFCIIMKNQFPFFYLQHILSSDPA